MIHQFRSKRSVSKVRRFPARPGVELLEGRALLATVINPPPGSYTPDATLSYTGEPVMQDVQIQGVYFANPTATQYSDSVTGLPLRPALDQFFGTILASSLYTQELNSYSVPAGTYDPPTSSSGGTDPNARDRVDENPTGGGNPVTSPGYTISTGSAGFVGDDVIPTALPAGSVIEDGPYTTSGTIQAYLDNEVLAGRLHADPSSTPDHLRYLDVVWVPAGVQVDAFGVDSTGFFGYHDSFQDAHGNTIVYSVEPLPGAAPSGKTGPAGPNASNATFYQNLTGLSAKPMTELQDLTTTFAHELFEAVTDPLPLTNRAWTDTIDPSGGNQPGGAENGDLGGSEASTYHGYTLQDIWGRNANDLSSQHGGPSAVASATGPVTRPSDTDFFINQIKNPTAGAFKGVFATFTDKDGANQPASNFTVGINWGDGSTSQSNDGSGDVTVVSNGDGTFNIIGRHTYNDPAGTRFGTTVANADGAAVVVTDADPLLGIQVGTGLSVNLSLRPAEFAASITPITLVSAGGNNAIAASAMMGLSASSTTPSTTSTSPVTMGVYKPLLGGDTRKGASAKVPAGPAGFARDVGILLARDLPGRLAVNLAGKRWQVPFLDRS